MSISSVGVRSHLNQLQHHDSENIQDEKVSENHIIGNYCHNPCRNVRISLSEIQA